MKKYFLFFLAVSAWFSAQNKIAGEYHISSGNPDDGGYNWILTEDHKFTMVTFGYMMIGKWEEDKENNLIIFTPQIPEKPYDVYGRYNPKVKGTKIMFENFDINEDSYIGWSNDEVQPVLSDDANCLPYPLTENFKQGIKTLVLGDRTRDRKDEFFVATLPEYNDLIIWYYPHSQRVPPFMRRMKNGKLFLDDYDEKATPRRDIDPETMAELKPYIEQLEKKPETFVVVNDQYRDLEADSHGEKIIPIEEVLKYNYNYNAKNATYTAKHPQSGGDAYHNMNVLYRYEKVELQKSEKSYKKSAKSVFNINCGNR